MDLNYRNYNPLNIRATDTDWLGKTGSNKGFEVFSNPEYGYRAAAKNLYTSNTKYNNRSVRDLITRWAPPNENNTEKYIDVVSTDLGVDPDADLGNLESNPELTKKLLKSMTKMEGANNNFNDKHIENGVALANGKEPSEIKFEKRPEDGSFNEGAEGEIVDGEETDEDIEVKERTEDKKKTVNRRLQETKLANKVSGNWMSSVDSPTYKWTLYIVNSEVFNKPELLEGSDSSAINKGQALIIAETGVTSEFAIDNVAMIQTVIPGQAHGNTTPGIIQFDLMEPLGFTFLDRILKAGIALGRPANLPSQHYVMRLEFVGRDPETGASIKYPNTFFYPIKINQVRSQTGPEGTRYNIIAFSLIKHAQTEAVTSTDLTVKDISTVQTFVEGLEKSFNQAEADKLSPTDQKNGLKPAKQIKILFADSTRIVGDKDAGIDSFNLKLKPWASTANADKGSGQSTSMDNVDAREAMVNAKTALAPYIQKQIQANCPAFATYVKEAKKKLGVVYSIHVEPKIEYGSAPEYAQTSESTVQVEAKLITFTIHVRTDETTPSLDEKDHKEKFVDTKYQVNRIKNLTLAKSYSYLYSGLNNEVLNYQIDVEQLYVTSKIPLDGIYHADGREQFTPTTPTKVTRFLDEVPYNDMGNDFNDIVQYASSPLGVEEQQKNETDNSDAMYAQRLQALAVRSMDAINFNIEIKGDPFWQGNTFKAHVQGKDTSPNISNTSLLISLLNYNPNPEDLLERQVRGPVDMISTGVYSVRSVESRFQSGRFTQNLLGFKDTNTNPALVLNQIIQITGSDNPSLTSTEGST